MVSDHSPPLVGQIAAARATSRGAADLVEVALRGAREMVVGALAVEADQYVGVHHHLVGVDGRRLVFRNGYGKERNVWIGPRAITLRAPRVADTRIDPRTGRARGFSSRILPRYARRLRPGAARLPLSYLFGLASGDCSPALVPLLGANHAMLSPSSIARLLHRWREPHLALRQRPLGAHSYAYVRGDAVGPLPSTDGEHRPGILCVVGVSTDGTRDLLSVEPGSATSTEAWTRILVDLRKRGLTHPGLILGDRSLGLWEALPAVFPTARRRAASDTHGVAIARVAERLLRGSDGRQPARPVRRGAGRAAGREPRPAS